MTYDISSGMTAPLRRRQNFLLWKGFLVVLLAVGTYIPIFAVFPETRDVPWVNFLLFVAGGVLLAIGVRRAFRQSEIYRGKLLGSILAGLSVVIFVFFCYGVFYAAKDLPVSATAVRVGQAAPDFTLASADGKQVSLSDHLKNSRAVVLIFYRGYW